MTRIYIWCEECTAQRRFKGRKTLASFSNLSVAMAHWTQYNHTIQIDIDDETEEEEEEGNVTKSSS